MVYGLTHKEMSLLDDNIVANVAVINPSLRPTLFPVWCVLQDGKIYFSTKSDHEKCRYIENNPSVGLSIVHPKGSIFLSLTGYATILDRDDFDLFDEVMGRIVHKYVRDIEKATEFVRKLKDDRSRRLVEITPDNPENLDNQIARS